MLSEVSCARLPRLVSPHALARIRGLIAIGNLAGGEPG
jgi:hypothetical protein